MDSDDAHTPVQLSAPERFMREMRYQAVRQSCLLRSIEFRVERARNNVITVPVFFDADMELVREYMQERHPSVNFFLKRVEP